MAAQASAFKKGAIVRVKLYQFLTYEDVEFRPGPRLNVVMGPNGTGKSSIVCAIAIGLGASPKVLGRADTLTEFILTGKDHAVTEIELLADEASGKTRTVERHISRGSRGTSKWKIDGKAATEPQVKKLVEGLNIQIANLCTFLPQEKVGEFSAFDDVGLLRETELALGGQALLDQHQALVDLEKTAADAARRAKSAEEELEEVSRRLKELEPDQARLARKREHEARAALCEQRLLWVRFYEKRVEALASREAKKAAVAAFKEADEAAKPARATRADAHRDHQEAQQRYCKVQQDINDKMDTSTRVNQAFLKRKDELDVQADGGGNLDRQAKTARQKADQAKAANVEAQRKLAACGAVDQAAIKRRVQALQPALAEAKRRATEAVDAAADARDARDAPKRAIADCKARLARLGGAEQRRAQDFARAHGVAGGQCNSLRAWIDANAAKFRRPVLGPVALEVKVESEAARATIEACVGVWIWRSFVCQSKHDYDLLYKVCTDKKWRGVNLHTCEQPKGMQQRPYQGAVLQRLKAAGAQGYLDEFIEAPAPVLDILYGHHQVGGILIGDEKFERIFGTAAEKDLRTPRGYLCFSCAADRSVDGGYVVSRFHATVSKYGQRDTTVATSRAHGPTGKLPAAAARVDDEETRLKQAEANAEKDLANAEKAFADATKASTAADRVLQDEQRKTDDTAKDLNAYNRCKVAVEITKDKMDRSEARAAKLEGDLEKESATQRRRVAQALTKVTAALQAYADADAAVHAATAAIAPAMALREFAHDGLKTADEALKEKEEAAHELQRIANEAMQAFDRLKNETRELKETAEAAAPSDDAELTKKLDELPDTVAEVEAVLEGERKEARAIHEDAGLAPKIAELTRRKATLEQKVGGMDAETEQHARDIDRLKAPWERTLRDALAELRDKFSDYMGALGARGTVQLVEAPTFAKWGLAIMVAFRDASDLQQLAAHVQSGGERSVSTIMFLMALQAHLPSPFRVVDEINQGMDEINERIVFKRIVLNSTGPDAPQYWLITPKLLQGLYDMEHPDVRALVVYNGAYNVKRPADWDLSGFLDKKRRAVAAG